MENYSTFVGWSLSDYPVEAFLGRLGGIPQYLVYPFYPWTRFGMVTIYLIRTVRPMLQSLG